MIILVGSQKGGCGKSTIAINICVELDRLGKKTVLVDADPQCTAANWAMDRYNKPELSEIHCLQKYDNIHDTLIELENYYECVVVDPSGRDSRELRTGMTAANILIVPFRPSQPDLDTIPNLCKIIKQACRLNLHLKVFGLMTMAPTNPVIQEIEESISYIQDYPEIQLLKTIIYDRKIYRDSMSEGMGVVEMQNAKAVEEIRLLLQEILA